MKLTNNLKERARKQGLVMTDAYGLAKKFKFYCWGLKSSIKAIAKKIVIAKNDIKNTSLPYFVLIHGTFSWIISSKYEDIIWDDIKEKLPKGTNSLYYVHID